MPDISMCSHIACELSETCYRHEDSGTTPTEYRQSWGMFIPTKEDDGLTYCGHYWPRGTLPDQNYGGGATELNEFRSRSNQNI